MFDVEPTKLRCY